MSQPNVLWICTDQQRWDTLGCSGNEFVTTPNLDRLAGSGVLFETAFCQNPVCMPSRTSFLTGKYPARTGVRRNGHCISDTDRILPRIFADAGYHCGLSGKLHLRHHEPDNGPEIRGDDGYAEFYWSPNPWPEFREDQYYAWLRSQRVEFERKVFDGSKHVECCVPAELSHTHWCAQKAIDFVESRAGEGPWLFSCNIFDPHWTLDPPEEYLRPYLDRLDDIPLPNFDAKELDTKPSWLRAWYEIGKKDYYAHLPYAEMTDGEHRLVRAAYWALCDLIDHEVGRMMESLDCTGQRDNTIVIFTSDHGESLGDHGAYKKGPLMYDPSVRVPLIVSWPAAVTGGRRSEALVELVDLAPTLLEAAGLDVPADMQGRSLLPLLRGERGLHDHREDAFCESMATNPGPKGTPPVYATMLRTQTHKVIVQHSTDEGELYDMTESPLERRNLWSDPASVGIRADLLRRLTDRLAMQSA